MDKWKVSSAGEIVLAGMQSRSEVRCAAWLLHQAKHAYLCGSLQKWVWIQNYESMKGGGGKNSSSYKISMGYDARKSSLMLWWRETKQRRKRETREVFCTDQLIGRIRLKVVYSEFRTRQVLFHNHIYSFHFKLYKTFWLFYIGNALWHVFTWPAD